MQTLRECWVEGGGAALPPEPLLWRVAVQVLLALRAVHRAGLAHRAINASKTLGAFADEHTAC